MAEREDLAEVYLNWGVMPMAARMMALRRAGSLRNAWRGTGGAAKSDNREHDLLDSNDYYQFQAHAGGGETLRGAPAASYHGDHSQRTCRRSARSRTVEPGDPLAGGEPKWIDGSSAMVTKAHSNWRDRRQLFAFDATTGLIDDHQYALLADAYLLDPKPATLSASTIRRRCAT
ncbi:cobaltochelatase subunit CobN [Pseudomonas sp. PCH446]